MASLEIKQLTLQDVYNMASSIGKDFESLMSGQENDPIIELMQKVISALEFLEQLVKNSQVMSEDLMHLQLTVEHQNIELQLQYNKERELTKEIEEVQQQWRLEGLKQKQYIAELEVESERLQSVLLMQERELKQSAAIPDCNIEYKKLIEELNQNLFTHKVCMCNLQQEIEQKNSELEAVQQQMERLIKLNVEYRYKLGLSENLTSNLILENVPKETGSSENCSSNLTCKKVPMDAGLSKKFSSDLTLASIPTKADLSKKNFSNITLENVSTEYGLSENFSSNSIKISTETGLSESFSSSLILEKVPTDAQPLYQKQLTNHSKFPIQLDNVNCDEFQIMANQDKVSSKANEKLAEEMLQREGKMIIDLKDPNRPRFTLRELQQVLIKRNELQAKLYEVEEELKSYRQSNDEKFKEKSNSESAIRKIFVFMKHPKQGKQKDLRH